MIGGPDRAVQRLDPVFAALAPGIGSADRTPGRTGPLSRVRAGLPALRPLRSGPLREDGAQRHRVRGHGRLRRGAERHPRRRRGEAATGGRRRDRPAARAALLPVRRHRPPRGRRGVAARQRDRVLVAGPHRRGPAGRPGARAVHRAASPTPARAAGPRSPPSTRACRRPCSPRPSTAGSPPAAATCSPTRWSPHSARSSVGTPRSRSGCDSRTGPRRGTRAPATCWCCSASPATSPGR